MVCTKPYGSLMFILHEWSEGSEHSERKGIKKGIKNFCPSLYGWEGVCLSVCLEPKVKLSKIKGPRVVCTNPQWYSYVYPS